MKQLIHLMGVVFACSALSAFAGTEAYSGKEMKQVAPAPPPECDFTWTGFYIGGNAGYAWGHAETDFQGTDIEGHDSQSPIIQNNGTPFPTAGSLLESHERLQWLGTVRGRIGFAPICRLLIYGTGGFAYGNVDYSANSNFNKPITYPVDFTDTKTGWTAGGGVEYAINKRWTVRAEYLHYDLGDANRTQNQLIGGVPQGPPFFVHYNFETSGEIVRGGLNFKF